ncbi:hypothetical protein MtrunA17_Chr2g0296761 [Medicago truncatula]|uniref:Uncharacterized protein n=1 Tax=Medicago truncatula TaxID=3880 RepID=A0A396J5M9_MEDTR|nr:translation factor GUF1 homolog, chloroplastic isoform X2 [Medicago truncatula]RHN73280.1 hypothetical protein MtrunA17_Chr2g0296761 [Medicago truncatula]
MSHKTHNRASSFYFSFSSHNHFIFSPSMRQGKHSSSSNPLSSQVGYLSASIRKVADARVGDTITNHFRKADNSLPGYEEATPMVFCGLFPIDADRNRWDCLLLDWKHLCVPQRFSEGANIKPGVRRPGQTVCFRINRNNVLSHLC